ncbi:hypothetical protein BHE74_00025531 [Ensete ventricosum]|uniref:COPA/B TPR domain-containing protein n=1 Tax=Ensete ventricosum TaxID=4639 RepID=A0A426YH13_ENSVE|nr:hypothetical protein B296_00051363 [Ensete ventricosum]RWW67054.1 hypothetical protein BHE74_00025531 [Ensete ventricosum]RZS05380.1 hypothetical protein BHM03_00035887 [Ensete ventricosum]
MLEDALEVATDPDYRFDLAVQLGRLEIAKAMEEIGVDEGQEEAVEVDVDYSTDSAVFVNGNEGEEQWGMNNEGTPSA